MCDGETSTASRKKPSKCIDSSSIWRKIDMRTEAQIRREKWLFNIHFVASKMRSDCSQPIALWASRLCRATGQTEPPLVDFCSDAHAK